MKILAMDTSNHPLSVALVEDDQLIAETTLNLAKNHSVYLMPVIEKLMAGASWQPEQLDRIVVAKGPGSYTGIRIAVTTAKTLAATLKIEMVGISSLALIAANVATINPDLLVVPFFDARRGNVFAGGFKYENNRLNNVMPEQHVSFEELLIALKQKAENVVLVGNITDVFKSQLEPFDSSKFKIAPASATVPSAYQLALLGNQETPVVDIDKFIPNYLRVTEAEAQWQKLHPGESKQSYVREV
ncbi:tRNA (adenosine(37)-N6)-threonylcarbamoyltransferase complex dimerization subunit type 1 TsaB [Paucilactobacillus kaifaensis]|uniref:tRNA (adenosine(37)-N6)-threonylcarbamoyltransferase complex dimerization subunit type 1 TsaB n=1 Tax=Paucilactobacillus kaifaensis TaxID=2559921 RepID=UPI0010F787FB|nr:tRNA (adenosine(37)-N6)-threonylcarbamoyltransferase complex dimerization subunit type 1 TsaB [Paucilactobacillus kaifaensis]